MYRVPGSAVTIINQDALTSIAIIGRAQVTRQRVADLVASLMIPEMGAAVLLMAVEDQERAQPPSICHPVRRRTC